MGRKRKFSPMYPTRGSGLPSIKEDVEMKLAVMFPVRGIANWVRTCAALITLLIVEAVGPASATPISTIDGLAPGTNYRVVFVTADTTQATSSDISSYNSFVQDEANQQGALTAPLGFTWTAIAGTESVSGYSNSALDPTSSATVMILDTVGDVVATSYASLFQVPLVAHTGQGILYDQYGVSAVHGFVAFDVYTGLTPAGEVDSGYALGDSIVSIGSPGLAFGRSGLHFAYNSSDREGAMYGISNVATVVPEPSSLILACLGVVVALVVMPVLPWHGHGPRQSMPAKPDSFPLREIRLA